MPELPEVEKARRLAERVMVGRRIERVHVASDSIVIEGVSGPRMRAALTGRTVLAARRRGKHLWLELDRRPWPAFHLGMTGQFRSPGESPLRLASGGRRTGDGWPPRFMKIRFRLDDGGELAMTSARRLGRIRLREDPATEPPIGRLGFDPLLDLPSTRELAALVSRRRICLKGLLLDQSFAAGVGNWIADEVLYQARLDPRRPAGTLSVEEIARLRSRLRSIVRKAVAVNADKSRFPRSWLFHRRWGKRSGVRTASGHEVRYLTLAGRTTAWVPAVQATSPRS